MFYQPTSAMAQTSMLSSMCIYSRRALCPSPLSQEMVLLGPEESVEPQMFLWQPLQPV